MRDFLALQKYRARRNVGVVSTAMGVLFSMLSPAVVFAQTASTVASTNSTVPFIAASDADASANWAGYVASAPGARYTAVSASWVMPTVMASSTANPAADATWIGVGGVVSRDLIQAGTQAIVQDGQVSYEAWYELLPDYQTHVTLGVHGGDSVSVSLAESSTDTWQLTFVNNTTGQKYQRTLNYSSSHSSAEWIEEMPVGGTTRRLGYVPLDDFGTATFTNAHTIVNGTPMNVNEAGASPLSMFGGDEQEALAVPSVIATDGASFSVARAAGTRVTVVQVILW